MQRSHNIKSFRFRRPDKFDFKAGQYIVVTIDVAGKKASKPFSLSSSPTEKDHIEFTKKLTGHEYSNALDSMRAGDSAGISGPYGKMSFEGEFDRIVLLSGGIGITPMRSICRYCTDMGLDTDVVLICSDKTEEDMVFWNELEEMMHKNRNLMVFQTLTRASGNWKGSRERINAGIIKHQVPDYLTRHFFVCGPPGMVESMMEILHTIDIPEEKIKKESITGY
ncbi:ferredoxin--NADP reductase [Methanolobus halotolerans]|uniref:ferredoxin--NADP reductase n=1 Tax=Methanolobus halotolerans TaxID=2052935 RepID=UPI001F2F23DC|nr:FAD-dependent oxidoreductase [Methanolobus halotolerans]